MYIVTNTTLGGEFTPSKADTMEEAIEWLYETSINNFLTGYSEEIQTNLPSSYEEIIKEGKLEDIITIINNTEDCIICKNHSCITYVGGSYNIMNIYNIDEI